MLQYAEAEGESQEECLAKFSRRICSPRRICICLRGGKYRASCGADKFPSGTRMKNR
jgi:hypothetical protein